MKYCTVFCWGVILFVLCIAAASADVYNLRLARVIVFGADEEIKVRVVFDSYWSNTEVRGSLVFKTDAAYVIREMSFDAWTREEIEEVDFSVADTVVTLGYKPNGSKFEVYSLENDRVYYISFIRRGLPGDDDPAVIFLIPVEPDLYLQLDYRYVE